ncbi:hypothetical protein IID19_03360 [Patescibacteria group bacterium]|nr:hypothetical protein [Patescibacteria group bacterium]
MMERGSYPEGTKNETEPSSSLDSLKEKIEIERKNQIPSEIAEILMNILQKRNPYSEKLKIQKNGNIDSTKRFDGSLSLITSALLGEITVEEFMKLAMTTQEKFPELKFSFNQDPEGQWIEYSVAID